MALNSWYVVMMLGADESLERATEEWLGSVLRHEDAGEDQHHGVD